jgi:hypothetical protein
MQTKKNNYEERKEESKPTNNPLRTYERNEKDIKFLSSFGNNSKFFNV